MAALRLTVALCLMFAVLALAGTPGSEYKQFLLRNVLPQSKMPRSYSVEPSDYFQKVPEWQRDHYYNHSYYVPPCGQNASAEEMNNYMFQTEELLTAIGLDIYDGAMWTIALGLLGEAETAHNYTKNVLVGHKTVQFLDIRGSAQCKGVMAWGQCTDPNQAGVCGLCYGAEGTTSLTDSNAYFFRMISDYWSIEGTVDARCPSKNIEWTWNDYKPILGENAWAILQGPAHNAMARYNNSADKIPDDDAMFVLGIPFLDAIEAMQVPTSGGNNTYGAVFFAPWNTFFGFKKVHEDEAASFSIENQGSLYAGLRSLYWVINNKTSSAHKQHLPRIKKLMEGIQYAILSAWNGQFFRQGGTYNHTTGEISWAQGTSPEYATDCQTWVAAVLGVSVVDGTFGPLASYNLWQFVKQTSGYYSNGFLFGVGYTNNSYNGTVFSGEWTYGAINWLRVMIAEGGYNSTIVADLQSDINNMLFGIETDLYKEEYVQNSTSKYPSIIYANRRYWIPFGWWANSIPATCSTAWAVAVANNYNPFNINGGSYGYTDEFRQPMVKYVGQDQRFAIDVALEEEHL